MCVCVCVCEREREREHVSVCVCVKKWTSSDTLASRIASEPVRLGLVFCHPVVIVATSDALLLLVQSGEALAKPPGS